MNGFDIVLSRVVPHSLLQNELARALTVETADCFVVDADSMNSSRMASCIVCTTALVGGEFPMLLSIDAPGDFDLPAAPTLGAHLSRLLGVSVLVDDGSSRSISHDADSLARRRTDGVHQAKR